MIRQLNEKPYVEMTLSWLNRCGISVSIQEKGHYQVPCGQEYKPFDVDIPADFSTATFPLCAASICGTEVLLKGLDRTDLQGDKVVIEHVHAMGTILKDQSDGLLVLGNPLQGKAFDLNDIPDSLPAMAVLACFAEGETRLYNVPQARLKECDRIEAMSTELRKMGADIREEPDGLIIRKSKLQGAKVHSRDDHRVAMALAIAGLAASGVTEIQNADCIAVTFPAFVPLMQSLGAHMEVR